MQRFAVVALLLAAIGGASVSGQRGPGRDQNLEALIAAAESIPPEFSSEALLRIVGLEGLDGRRRRTLLDEAFMRAYNARDDYRVGSALQISVDSRQGAQRFASASALNRVSLQTRAVEMLATIDPPYAREAFDWIDVDLAPTGCDALLVPFIDEYYTALSLLARTTFRDRAEGLRFLELHLWRARVPSELPAVVRAVQRFRPTLDEAAYLEVALGWILDRTANEPRGFSNASLDLITRMGELQRDDRERGLTGWHAMESLRAYLVAQLSGPRCADSVIEPLAAPAFNGVLGRIGADHDVKPIEPQALRPAKVLPAAKLEMYWQTTDARRLHESWLQLRGRNETVALALRLAPPWRNQAERFLADVEQWAGTREADRDYLYQKGMLLTGLIDLMPASPARSRALRAFVDFMRHEEGDRALRPLWFALLNRYIDTARGDDRREMLDALETSSDVVLSLYGQLARRSALEQQHARPGT